MLKTFIKILEGNVAFYEATEEELKGKLAKATVGSTPLAVSFEPARAQVVVLREKLAAKYVSVKSIIQDSCETLGPSPRGLVENPSAVLKKSVSNAFINGSVDAQIHADTAIDSITLYFQGVLHRKRARLQPKVMMLLIQRVTPRSSSLSSFPFRPQSVNGVSCFYLLSFEFPFFPIFL